MSSLNLVLSTFANLLDTFTIALALISKNAIKQANEWLGLGQQTLN
jgi:hypothetical protein